MDEPPLPAQLVEARRTPLFDFDTLPDALASSHRTTVWAELRVQPGTVRYVDLREPSAAMVPGVDRVGSIGSVINVVDVELVVIDGGAASIGRARLLDS